MKLFRVYFLRQIIVAAGALFMFLPAAAQTRAVPELTVVTGSVSEDGHLKLSWDIRDPGDRVEIQQATRQNFTDAITVYEGPDNATVISGLDNGHYYFRLRRVEGGWSDTASVHVQHHALALALTLCGLGAIVFLCTVSVVVTGARQYSDR